MNLSNLVEALESLTGFVIVMLALAVLWGLTAMTGRLFIARAAREATAKAAPAPVPEPVIAASGAASDRGSSDDELDDDLVVIAAAAASLLSAAHRIVSVRPVDSSWGRQGRRDIHASHRIR